ncbi:MAG: hypothetical protein HC876_10770 [Chloroflexaceae bacterium]|nr:hypothetical protein [Chloroflexaceae bacterium]NJO05951.1 hypothetical protein [Chloroflexaceae bacterium]
MTLAHEPPADSYEAPLSERLQIVLLFGLAGMVVAYLLLRYRLLWGEGDTATFTVLIELMLREGTLLPEQATYANGFGFQALAMQLVYITGLSLAQVQLIGGWLLMLWLVIPMWLLYRELLNGRGMLLASALLLMQPEFLFGVMRGTHEKFTRGLTILCLYLLLRSLRSQNRPAQFAGLVISFYLSAYALITFNSLLATSFIAATAGALVLSWLVMREGLLTLAINPTVSQWLQRLVFATATCLIISFVFIFYLYPPAQSGLRLLDSTLDRAAALMLDVETAINPYDVINIGWINTPVYLVLTLSNWLLLGVSALLWLWQSGRWLQGRWRPASRNTLLLWAFYGAFGLQGALSILVDFSGAISGNLQHRVFPSFAIVAVAMVVRALLEWIDNRKQVERWLYRGGAALFSALVVLSIIKATNEPLVSNKWLFYHPAERTALAWASTALADRSLWVGFDERLIAADTILLGAEREPVELDGWLLDPTTSDFMVSDILRQRALRLGLPLPVAADDFITYDNGKVQVYHRRPLTIYQR